MKRIKIVLFAMIICCSMVLGMACNKDRAADTEETKEEELVISDNAVRYDYPSENLLQYKGMIIDKEFIIYVFGWGSSMARDLFNKRDEKMKVWFKYSDDSDRKIMDDWKVVQNPEGYYLVIYCDPQTIDLEKGLLLSNFLQEDGNWDWSIGIHDGIAYYVTNSEIPKVKIWCPGYSISEQWQVYRDTIIEEMCKYYIAELLVFGYSDECLICSRGYIPCNKAFIRNIDEPIYLIGIEEYGYSPNVYSSDEILNESESGVALMDMTDYRYVSSADFPDGLAVDIDNNIYIDELWIRKSTFDSLNHSSHQQDNIKYKKICCISDDSTCELFCHIPKKCINNRVKGVFKYTYKHYEMDDTIMFKMVREYLPNNINDGWIPLDEDKRKEMFKDSYKKLERYVTHFQKREEQRREKRRYNISKCILS